MAKTNPAAPASDLSTDMLSFVASRKPAEPAAPAAAPAAAPEPDSTPAAAPALQEATSAAPAPVERPEESQEPKGRKEPVATDASKLDYAETFLQPVRGRKPKAVYVTEDLHTALATITQASPDGIGLADLLINIVTHHFETFGPNIRQFLNAQEKLRKNRLPY